MIKTCRANAVLFRPCHIVHLYSTAVLGIPGHPDQMTELESLPKPQTPVGIPSPPSTASSISTRPSSPLSPRPSPTSRRRRQIIRPSLIAPTHTSKPTARTSLTPTLRPSSPGMPARAARTRPPLTSDTPPSGVPLVPPRRIPPLRRALAGTRILDNEAVRPAPVARRHRPLPGAGGSPLRGGGRGADDDADFVLACQARGGERCRVAPGGWGLGGG